MSENFEYLVVDYRPTTITNSEDLTKMDDLGSQGWELVSALQVGSLRSLYFKRPLSHPRSRASVALAQYDRGEHVV